MASVNQVTVVGVFEDAQAAQRAVRDLRQAGFPEDQLGVVARHTGPGEPETTDSGSGTKVEEGAATGVVAGAGIGALWALAIAVNAIPGVGPVISGGILTALLSGAGGGLVVGGIVGALIGLGLPEHEARYYEQELHAGRTLVSVRSTDRSEEARAILQRHGASDVNTAAASASGRPS